MIALTEQEKKRWAVASWWFGYAFQPVAIPPAVVVWLDDCVDAVFNHWTDDEIADSYAELVIGEVLA